MKFGVALIVLVGLVACVAATGPSKLKVISVPTAITKINGGFTFTDDLLKGSTNGKKIGTSKGSCFELPNKEKEVLCSVIHQFTDKQYSTVSISSVGSIALFTGGTGKYHGIKGGAKLTFVPNADPTKNGYFIYEYPF